MIKKARLLEENAKLIRKIFIFEHIGIGYNASIQEKEEATKRFLELNPTFTAYEVCTTITTNREFILQLACRQTRKRVKKLFIK